MRFRFVEDRRTDYPVTIMCGVLGVSPAGYYAWRARPESQRSIANRELVNDIKRVHRDACGRYGSPRDGVVGGRAVVQISISWIGMIVRIKWSALQQTHGYEYLVRFALGGLATLLAGVIADRFGPETGGLFLAFPAILCASATLVEKHERHRKTRQGLKGAERGRRAAALDAMGAGWGSLALATFAIAIWKLAPYSTLPALGFASMLWPLVAAGLFFLRRKLRRG